MTKERRAKMPLEKTVGGIAFYTVWGMCSKIEGRNAGSHLSITQLLKYVKEGCPCFEHAGMLLFEQDLTGFMEWLRKRKAARQIKAQERIRRIYGR
ncbi:MAG: hypothetical protein ACI351_01880 [Candidatus Avelusimicrobium sp.]|uniref:hypothetical protein n=1 Tax=Candidatus Avelusimicrobium sp. TaxID=3048833 RepID=UPI003F0865A1